MAQNSHDILANFEEFMAAQESTKTIVRNLGKWTTNVDNMLKNEHANDEIASFYSSLVSNLLHLNDNLKRNIHYAKSMLEKRKKHPATDQNAALLRSLMECTVDESVHVENSPATQLVYEDSSLGGGYVSHIVDEKHLICYILDVNRMPTGRQLYGDQLKPLTRLPEPNEIFAYHLNGKFMFRALRMNDNDSPAANPKQYCAKFIDVGCTMWIDTSRGYRNHYALDASVQQLPAFAMKCQIVQMPANYNLLNFLHEKVTFRVLKLGNNIVYVELLPESTNPFLNWNAVGGKNKKLYSFFQWNAIAHHSQSTQSDSSCSVSPNEWLIPPSLESPVSTLSSLSNHSGDEGVKAARNHFTETMNASVTHKTETTKVLAPNEWNDFNAHEQRMQEFADSLSEDENNIDIKPRCKIRQKEPTLPDTIMPSVGETIAITVSFVIDVERFYAYIPMHANTINVNQLQKEMNTDEMRRSYQQLHQTPPINSCVFAMYQNFIYRARIMCHFDQMNYQVFYIDYGNSAKVNLNELFRWNSHWDNVPSQIYPCRLHGLRRIRFFDFEAMRALQELTRNQTLTATVRDIIDGKTFVVSVRDASGIDISTTLCEKNFAKTI